MSYNATGHNIVMGAAVEVLVERRTAREVMSGRIGLFAQHSSVAVGALPWGTQPAPGLQPRSQAFENTDVLIHADLLLAIFWTRIGTPTGSDPSGTVEEIRKHVAAGKPTMIYFSSKPVSPDSVEPALYAALKDFKKEYMEK